VTQVIIIVSHQDHPDDVMMYSVNLIYTCQATPNKLLFSLKI